MIMGIISLLLFIIGWYVLLKVENLGMYTLDLQALVGILLIGFGSIGLIIFFIINIETILKWFMI